MKDIFVSFFFRRERFAPTCLLSLPPSYPFLLFSGIRAYFPGVVWLASTG